MAHKIPPLPNDGIYRAILFVLVGSMVIGAIVALAGELILHDKAISQLGGWIAVVCGVIYFVFRWLGRREAARRAAGRAAGRATDRDDPDERSG